MLMCWREYLDLRAERNRRLEKNT